MKKILKSLTAITLSSSSVFTTVACGSSSNIEVKTNLNTLKSLNFSSPLLANTSHTLKQAEAMIVKAKQFSLHPLAGGYTINWYNSDHTSTINDTTSEAANTTYCVVITASSNDHYWSGSTNFLKVTLGFNEQLKTEITNELNNYSMQSYAKNHNYIEVNFQNEQTPNNIDSTWTSAVQQAVYNDLKTSIPDFSDNFNIHDISISNSDYVKSFDYSQLKPITASVQIDGVNQTIEVGTTLLTKLNILKNQKSTSGNPYSVNINNLKMSDLVTSGFYTTVSQSGQTWLKTTSINTFFNDILNPFNPKSIASSIPSVIPKKIASTGKYDTTDPNAKSYIQYMNNLKDYVKTNLGIDWTKQFDILGNNNGNGAVTMTTPTSLFSIADGLAPDIVHFTNFIKKNANSSEKQNFTTGNFMSLFIKYLLQPIKNYNNDGFSNIDKDDQIPCNLKTNFDVFVYDLFDNWYSGTKPSYGLIGETSETSTGFSMVNNDGTDTLNNDLRVLKQTAVVDVLGTYNIGYTLLNFSFKKGYEKGIFSSLINSFLSPKYTPTSDLNITLDFGKIPVVGTEVTYQVGINFKSVHQSEFSNFISSYLNLSPATEVSTEIADTTKNTTGTFKLYYTSDGANWSPVNATDITSFTNFLNTNNVTDYKFVMSGLNTTTTFTTQNNKQVTLQLNNSFFNVQI